MMLAKDVACDDASLFGLGNVGNALREDGVSVVCAAILCQEANETLQTMLVFCI